MKKILLIILLVAAVGGGTFLYSTNRNPGDKIFNQGPVFSLGKNSDGKYVMTESTKFYQSLLEIKNLDAAGFDFIISAAYGINDGGIEGRANISGRVGTYTEIINNADKTECKLVFTFTTTDQVLVEDIGNECASSHAGVNVSFNGDYAKDFKIKEKKLDQSFFKTPADLESFKSTVDKDMVLFDDIADAGSSPEEPDGNAGYYQTTFRIPGLYTIMEAIIVVEPDSNISAAIIDDGVVRFYTNIPKYKNTLPESVESWRNNFKDKKVVFTYKEKEVDWSSSWFSNMAKYEPLKKENAKTYTNSEYKYSFQYPDDWVIEGGTSSEEGIVLRNPKYPKVIISAFAHPQEEDTSPTGEPFPLINGSTAYYRTNTIEPDTLARMFVFQYKHGNMYLLNVEYPLPYDQDFFDKYNKTIYQIMRSLDVR